jgi:hypothetical protein
MGFGWGVSTGAGAGAGAIGEDDPTLTMFWIIPEPLATGEF